MPEPTSRVRPYWNHEIRKAWKKQIEAYQAEGSGYAAIHGTRPQTLAYGLNDSPVGLAAWIVEKFWSWSDCGGDVERAFTKDELLTNVMIYWLTETINSSIRLHFEFVHHPSGVQPGERVEVPTGVAVFPREILNPPRSLAESMYDIRRWAVMPSGGHFPALEKPGELVKEIRAFFRPLRE